MSHTFRPMLATFLAGTCSGPSSQKRSRQRTVRGFYFVYQKLKVAVVVPAYNEEKLIAWTISSTPDFVDHIVVIDDASSDATVAEATGTGDPRLVLIRHESNT